MFVEIYLLVKLLLLKLNFCEKLDLNFFFFHKNTTV